MLLQRFLTAVILIPLMILAIFKTSPLVYELLMAVIIIYAAWEWSLLMGLRHLGWRSGYTAFITLMIATIAYSNILLVLSLAAVTWLIALFWVIRYPHQREQWASPTVTGVLGVFVLVPCWYALATLRIPAHGAWLVMFLFVLIWGVDSGAYFAGRYFGKHKLAVHVSPGKTIEGVIGGAMTALVIGAVGAYWFGLSPNKWALWFLLILITSAFAVLGDLLESMLKRNAGVKDCSAILPGHGGVLDRIDSLTAAAPIFVLGLLLFGV